MQEFFIKAVGVSKDNRQEIIKQLGVGDPVVFIPELSNQYDSSAVRIETLNRKVIGYISTEINKTIFDNMINNKGMYLVEVSAITGGGDKLYGCNLKVKYEECLDKLLVQSIDLHKAVRLSLENTKNGIEKFQSDNDELNELMKESDSILISMKHILSNCQDKKSSLKKELFNCEQSLKKAGFFQFSVKKNLKEKIEALNSQINIVTKQCFEVGHQISERKKESEQKKKKLIEKLESNKRVLSTLTAVAKAREHFNATIDTLKEGDTLYLGIYMNDTDKLEPIEWKTLIVEENKALLITKHAIDCKRFTEDLISNWANSTLRKFLNSKFLESFTPDELEIILETKCNNTHEIDSLKNEDDTIDKVFCLSYEEAEKYFMSDKDRVARVTNYAYSNGAAVSKSTDNCFWWLRSVSNMPMNYAVVDSNGSVMTSLLLFSESGFGYMPSDRVSVRPAMWIKK